MNKSLMFYIFFLCYFFESFCVASEKKIAYQKTLVSMNSASESIISSSDSDLGEKKLVSINEVKARGQQFVAHQCTDAVIIHGLYGQYLALNAKRMNITSEVVENLKSGKITILPPADKEFDDKPINPVIAQLFVALEQQNHAVYKEEGKIS